MRRGDFSAKHFPEFFVYTLKAGKWPGYVCQLVALAAASSLGPLASGITQVLIPGRFVKGEKDEYSADGVSEFR